MKAVLINGQNHKGSTYRIGRMLAEKIADGGDIKEIFLPRDLPEFCCGCINCIVKSEKLCPHYKYTGPIAEALDSADVLIFTTPVYVYHATGSMKAFLDHFAYRWMVHRPEGKMFSKQAVCVATAAGAGMRPACKDIRDSLRFWGVARIYSCGLAVYAASWDGVSGKIKAKAERKTDAITGKIKSRYGKVTPSLRAKLTFYIMRMMQKKIGIEANSAYWKGKGWYEKARPWKVP